MRIPSATGIVFASLAISGSTLAAPTPASPNPGSPNPNASGLDSPRPVDSPTMHSPMIPGTPRSLLGSPAIRDGSGSRRSIPRYARREAEKKKAAKSGDIHAQGLGLLPQPVKDTVGGLLKTVDGIVSGLPVVGGLLPAGTISNTGDSLLDILDTKDKGKKDEDRDERHDHKAPRMARSLAHMDDDAEALEPRGLGIISQPAEDSGRTYARRQLAPPSAQQLPTDAVTNVVGGLTTTLGQTLKTVATTLDGVPVAGPIVAGVVNTVADTVSGVGSTLPRRATPNFGQDGAPNPSSFVDSIASVEIGGPEGTFISLPGEVSSMRGQQVSGSLADTVSSLAHGLLGRDVAAPVDPTQVAAQVANAAPAPVGGVAQTAAGTVIAAAAETGATGGDDGNDSANGLPNDPTQVPGQLPDTLTTIIPVSLPIPGSALRNIINSAIGTPGAVASDPTSAPSTAQNTITNVAGQATQANPAGQAAPMVPRDISTGTPADSVLNTATGALGSTPVSGVLNTVTGTLGGTPVGGVLNTIAGATSGLPVNNVVNTVTGATANSPAAGILNTATGMTGMVGSTIGGALNTVTGATAGLPVAGAVKTVLSAASNSPAGVVVKTVGGGTSNPPTDTVMNTLNGVTSKLPVNTIVNTASGALSSTPLGGARNTATGAASGLPLSSTLNTVTGTVAGTPLGGVVNTAKGVVGGLAVNTVTGATSGLVGGVPIVGGLLSGTLGALSPSSDGFGAKSVQDGQQDESSATTSSSAASSTATASM